MSIQISSALNHIKQIPQLSQVQYDTSSQLFYVDEALKKMGFEGIQVPLPKYIDDNRLSYIIDSLQKQEGINIDLSEKEKAFVAYQVANRLGLYDAANALRWW